MDPEMATEKPNESPEAAAAAVSSACCDQAVPDRTNMYAAPVLEFLPGAPTTTVDPEIATEGPKRSLAAPSAGVSWACGDQAVPERTNTYAAPVCKFLLGAPTAIVDPEMATEEPKASPEAASAAVSSARWDQAVPERTNTYTAPVPPALPTAPTTTVDPEMATEVPNRSLAAAVSSACCDQTVPDGTNTYAAPGFTSLPGPPTTAVDLAAVGVEMATDQPSWSFAAPSAAVSLACWKA